MNSKIDSISSRISTLSASTACSEICSKETKTQGLHSRKYHSHCLPTLKTCQAQWIYPSCEAKVNFWAPTTLAQLSRTRTASARSWTQWTAPEPQKNFQGLWSLNTVLTSRQVKYTQTATVTKAKNETIYVTVEANTSITMGHTISETGSEAKCKDKANLSTLTATSSMKANGKTTTMKDRAGWWVKEKTG